jgi:PKD repeat protein
VTALRPAASRARPLVLRRRAAAAALLGALTVLMPALAGSDAVARTQAVGAKARAQAAVSGRIVAIARTELAKGVREVPDGSNRAPAIRRYETATAGAMFGAPWCAYFVSYVARTAGAPIGPGGKGMGYVPYIRAWARQTGRWTATPRAGMLITFPQHVGIVETVYSNHTLTTIEGNAGNAVRRRWRRWSEASGYVRIATASSPPVAAPPLVAAPPSQGPVRQALVARIHAYPGTTIAPGQEIQFTSNDSSGSIVRSEWDLDGNGSLESRGDSVQRTYPRAGSYTIRLRVTDSAGRTAQAKTTVTVRANQAPVARMSVSATTLRVGDTLTADAAASSDPDGRIVRYEWDLNGDGIWGKAGAQHSYRFEAPGDYNPGLRVTDDAGNVSEVHVGVHVDDHPAPTARASCDRLSVSTGDTLRCSSDDGSSAYRVTRRDWDFDGNGTIDVRGTPVAFSYARPGDYTARLRVTDVKGRSAETTFAVRVANRAPTARIVAPATAALGQGAAFDGSTSSDPDGSVAKYEWDLDGDGLFETTGAKPSFLYAAPGTYAVRLRVTDDAGARSVTTASVRVIDQAPVARIVLPSPAPAGSALTFDGTGSTDADGAIARYDWDIDGDGVFETTGAKPSFRYSAPGTYAVRLRVTDAFGASSTVRATLAVG